MSMTQLAGQPRVLYDSGGWYICTNDVVVSITVRVKTASGSWASAACPYTLPESLRPKVTYQAPVATSNGASVTGVMFANTNGTITVANQGGSGSDGTRMGSLSYVVV